VSLSKSVTYKIIMNVSNIVGGCALYLVQLDVRNIYNNPVHARQATHKIRTYEKELYHPNNNQK
jgi:hypothetical protein